MSQPELFDVVELLVNLPDHNLQAGAQGAIAQPYSDQTYEVEFTNSAGETLAPRYPFISLWWSGGQPQKPGCLWQKKLRRWWPFCQRKRD